MNIREEVPTPVCARQAQTAVCQTSWGVYRYTVRPAAQRDLDEAPDPPSGAFFCLRSVRRKDGVRAPCRYAAARTGAETSWLRAPHHPAHLLRPSRRWVSLSRNGGRNA